MPRLSDMAPGPLMLLLSSKVALTIARMKMSWKLSESSEAKIAPAVLPELLVKLQLEIYKKSLC
jgi:hypothetical protein